jgi:transcriptional regulator EpsA
MNMPEMRPDLTAYGSKLIILDRPEEERMIRTMEAAVSIDQARELFMWAQGHLQSLLPHEVMVCIQYDASHQLMSSECLRGKILPPHLLETLSDPSSGLAVRIATHCQESVNLPYLFAEPPPNIDNRSAELYREIKELGLGNVLVHGTDMLVSGSSWFVLFGVAASDPERQSYFFQLLLPFLHLVSLRVLSKSASSGQGAAALVSLSDREREILNWITEGKSNAEIGEQLHLSSLTVKNHLQRIYRKLNVRNRAHAVSKFRSFPTLR